MVDVENLIKCVFERPAIWDKNSKLHANRSVVDRLWTEVSKEMSCDEIMLRKKWKYLRDQYAVELGKAPLPRSNEPIDSNQMSKWQYFRPLMFLRDIVKPRASNGNLAQLIHGPGDNSLNASSQEGDCLTDDRFPYPASDDHLMSSVYATDICVKEEDCELNDSNKRPFPGDDQMLDGRSSKKRVKTEDCSQTLLDLERQELQFLMDNSARSQRKGKDEDEDLLFFKSLLPHVKIIPRSNILRFRNQIQELVQQYAYPSQDMAHTSNVNQSLAFMPQTSHSYSSNPSPSDSQNQW